MIACEIPTCNTCKGDRRVVSMDHDQVKKVIVITTKCGCETYTYTFKQA